MYKIFFNSNRDQQKKFIASNFIYLRSKLPRMDLTELHYAMALQAVPKIGDITAKKLIRHCGSPEAVFKSSKASLLAIGGIGTVVVKAIQSSKALKLAENEIDFIQRNNIRAHYFQQDSYPFRLKHCVDGPIVLFQKGNIQWSDSPVVSIVGTRQLTSYGKTQCKQLVESLAVFNPIVVSGFAYGADIAAHKAALDAGLQTVGCMAHGLQKTYPYAHKQYRPAVEAQGGFVTDYWSTAKFDPSNFLRRNRLIAGLSQATIVIESGAKGGSLVTARLAFEYNREVFAIPGRASDSQSVGCNTLIKTNQAHLLSTPADVPYILNWDLEINTPVIQKQLTLNLEPEEQLLYDFLKKEGQTLLDLIALNCDMPTSKAAALLLNLELKGVVRPLPGKRFELS